MPATLTYRNNVRMCHQTVKNWLPASPNLRFVHIRRLYPRSVSFSDPFLHAAPPSVPVDALT